MGIDLSSMKEIYENKASYISGNLYATNDLLVDEIMEIMGYNKKRVRGVNRLYDKEVDWEVEIGDRKRFVVSTTPYGDEIPEESINFLVNYCAENGYPYGLLTNGDKIQIVSAKSEDEQPILEINVTDDDSKASEILEKYAFKNYDSTELENYYMQFQFTMQKLRDAMQLESSRESLINLLGSFVEHKDSERNKEIIENYVDGLSALTLDEVIGKQGLSEEQREKIAQLEAVKVELQTKIEGLIKEVKELQSKLDSEATSKSELQSEYDDTLDKLKSTEDSLADTQKKLDASEEEVAALQTKLTEISNELESVKDANSEEYNAAITKLADAENRIIELEKEIEESKKLVILADELKVNADIGDDNGDSEAVEGEPSEETSEEPESVDGEPVDGEPVDGEPVDGELDTDGESEEQASNSNDAVNELIESYLTKIEKLEKELEAVKVERDALSERAESLQIELDELKEKQSLNTSLVDLDSIEIDVTDTMDTTTRALFIENRALKKEVEKLNGELGDIESYRKQISDLSIQLVARGEEVAKLTSKVDELQTALDNKGSEKEALAYDMLNAVDDRDGERAYAFVIDNKLFTCTSIKDFIGTCIMEIYKKEALKLSPILYDSSFFKVIELNSNSNEHCDFVLGTKKYQLSLEGDTEESIIAKIVSLFKSFEGIVFVYKLLGSAQQDSAKAKDTKSDESDDNTDLSSEFDEEEILKATERRRVLKVVKNDADKLAEVNAVAPSQEPKEHEPKSNYVAGMTELGEEVIGYVCFGLRGTAQLIDYPYADPIGIDHIYLNGRYFNIAKDTEGSIQRQFVSVLQAMLANNPNKSYTENLRAFRTLDIDKTNGLILRLSPDTKTNLRIPMSHWVVGNMVSLEDAVSALIVVADTLGFDEQDLTLIYECKHYSQDNEILSCVISQDQMVAEETIDPSLPPEMDRKYFAKNFDGSMPDYIVLTRNSLNIQNLLIGEITKITTEDYDVNVKGQEDIAQFIKWSIQRAYQSGKNIDFKQKIGRVLGSDSYLISTKIGDVTPDYIEIEAANQVYYVSTLKPAQQLYALIKLQKVLCDNRQIQLGVLVNTEAYDFYKNEFYTSDPALDILVKSIIGYIDAK